MAAKPKEDSKPKIKVEEIIEEKEEEAETKTDTTPPKVASFSQLDSKKSKDETEAPKDENETAEEAPEEKSESKLPEDESGLSEKEEEKKEEVSSGEVKEWLKEVRPDTTKEVSKSGGPNLKIILVILIILLLLGAIVGGVIYYQRGVEQRQEVTAPTTPIAATSTPTPTEETEPVDLTTYSVSILNGSGTAGEAGNAQGLLIEAGFVEENVETGNADSYDYEETEISLKEGTPNAVFEAIQTALGETYTIVRSEEPLGETSEFDVLIIVGQRAS